MENWTSTWQTDLTLAGCEHCDWIFLLAPQHLPLRCPHCAQQELTTLDETADKPIYTQPPELMLPYQVDANQARQKLTAFAKSGWLAPPDLKDKNLHGRLRPIYLPMWLVDADVQAQWQAEMGYDYDVISHKEDFRNGKWHTREVKETRIRWEPRLGRLQRPYQNRRAPALEEQAEIEKKLGKLNLDSQQPYQAQAVQNTLIRLPNRAPDDAWSEAEMAFKYAAAAECRQAAAANHIRQYKWQPDFSGQNWTQLLYPIYTTYYQDDENKNHILYLHGQTGTLVGVRKASMKRARKWSFAIGAVAAVLFFFSFMAFLLGFFLSDALFLLAGMALIGGMVTAVTAFIPILYAWSINRAVKESQSLNLILDH